MHTPRRIITTTLIATVGLAAASAPAIASPIGGGYGVRVTSHPATATATYSRQDKQVVTPVTYAAQPVTHPGQPANAPTGGFTALDAAFSAAGGLALLLLVMGSAAALLRRRARAMHQPAAVAH
jgi:hypothetical protein